MGEEEKIGLLLLEANLQLAIVSIMLRDNIIKSVIAAVITATAQARQRAQPATTP